MTEWIRIDDGWAAFIDTKRSTKDRPRALCVGTVHVELSERATEICFYWRLHDGTCGWAPSLEQARDALLGTFWAGFWVRRRPERPTCA